VHNSSVMSASFQDQKIIMDSDDEHLSSTHNGTKTAYHKLMLVAHSDRKKQNVGR